MSQKQKQFQTAKSTLRLIANNSEEILSQMEVAAKTNVANLKVYFENLRDILNDIEELNFQSNIDNVLSLRAELIDFLNCFQDNIVYYNCTKAIPKKAAPLINGFEEYIQSLDEASEYDVTSNVKIMKKNLEGYRELCILILKSKSEKSITEVTIYRSLVNVFENFLNSLSGSIKQDESIYDIIQYLTILDAMKHYYVDSISQNSFYSIMLNTKISQDTKYLKGCLENTKQLEGFDFAKTLEDIKKYELYLGALKEECLF